MFRILTLNNIAASGLDQFEPQKYLVGEDVTKPDAILVRSFKMHDYDIPDSVKVIGRAGVGTNNIPVDQLTRQGIPVLNTPGANANAVKELVITGMLLACRNICAAWHYVRNMEGDNAEMNKQIEDNKKQFAGFELPGKTLGIIGLGNIGVKVANAALSLGMNVIGYDPAITVKRAWQLSSDVEHAEKLDEVLTKADFVTLHVPLLESTRHLINKSRLQIMKPTAVLLNFARDEIIDNKALLEFLNENKIRNYVTDFPNSLFKSHPQVISLPHLGASTREAEENCAIMAAQQVKSYLNDGTIKNSVNFPDVKMPRTEGCRIAIANANVPNMVAQISAALSKKNINIIDMINKSREEIAYTLLDVNSTMEKSLLNEIEGIDGVIKVRIL